MLSGDHEKYQIIVTRKVMHIVVITIMLYIRNLTGRKILSIACFKKTQRFFVNIKFLKFPKKLKVCMLNEKILSYG